MAEKEKQTKAKAKPAGADKAKAAPKGKKDKAEAAPAAAAPSNYQPRLKVHYREVVRGELKKRFNFKNDNLIPKITKIVLNVGVGGLHQDQKFAESLASELEQIAGQKPVLTKARKSISNFKLRQGMLVGCRVTLRRDRMFEFLDRLISIVIPRIRDFRGLSDRSFDGRGNYNFGVKEQIIFPEIDYDKVVKIHGMDICIATTARSDDEALELLKAFGFPFTRRPDAQSRDAA